MVTFQRDKERVLVLMSAGNLAVTQSVVHILQQPAKDQDQPTPIYAAKNMFDAARVVGHGSHLVMAGHGCSKNGVTSFAYVPGHPRLHVRLGCKRRGCAGQARA